MCAHLVKVQRPKQKGPVWNATQVINSDGEQLISSSSGGLCFPAADYGEAELRESWLMKMKIICGAAASWRSERPEPVTASFATVLRIIHKKKKRVPSFQSSAFYWLLTPAGFHP